MARTTLPTITPTVLSGLAFLHHFRWLTIAQYARAVGLSHNHAGEQLRMLERHHLVRHFGNTPLQGRGKTPKAYFLTRKGFALLQDECGVEGSWHGAHTPVRWSPKMYHRMRVVDFLIAVHAAVRQREHIALEADYLEYRRVVREGRIQRETHDLIEPPDTPDNRIIPDAAFVLRNEDTQRSGLFLVEVDMGTEAIAPLTLRTRTASLSHKLSQYARYLASGAFRARYGSFSRFTLLTLTTSERRVENIRRTTPRGCEAVFLFSTFDRALPDPLDEVWKTGAFSDTRRYPLVR